MQQDETKVCPKCGSRYDPAAVFCQRDGTRLGWSDLPPDPAIGTVLLDQFRIEEVVGAGGMGTVYRAHQTTIDRDVAIKILHPELTLNLDAVRRFRREAKVASKLDHPNVTKVFLFGQLPDGSLYLVMPYLVGRSLHDVLRDRGALPADRALHIATQICDGVGEAHAQGVVHRDVKPENVLLVERSGDPDFVKVLDFGIARWMTGEQTIVTQTGLIFGTARYISPEGAAGEQTDARSDVYSIAVLTYQMLAGRTPFDAPSPVGLLIKHINDTPPDLGTHAGRPVPVAVSDVVMGALAKNPDDRPRDARALGLALREASIADGVPLPELRASLLPSTPSSRGRPAAQRPPAEAYTTPTPVLPVATDPGARMPRVPSPTLEGAPNPFASPTGQLSVPGLRVGRRGSGAFGTVLLAFVLGASAVTAGAYLVQSLISGEAAVGDLAQLEARARAALSRGDIDTPPDENVAELSARMLRADPGSAPARSIRSEAARRLREEAATAAGQGSPEEARSRYERALTLVPRDPVTLRALAALEGAVASPPRTAEAEVLRAVPADVRAGAAVTIIAETARDFSLGASPRFVIEGPRRARREVEAAPDPSGHGWMSTYTFRRAGSYRVTFGVDGDDYALRGAIVVRAASHAHRRRGPGEGPVTTQQASGPLPPGPPPEVPPDESIDWRLPDDAPRQSLPVPRESLPLSPEAPWPDDTQGGTGPQTPGGEPPPAPEPPPPPPPWSSG